MYPIMNRNENVSIITLDGQYDITAFMCFCTVMAQLKGYEMYVDTFVINIFDTFSNPSDNMMFDDRYYSLDMVMLSFFTIKLLNIMMCTTYALTIKSIYVNTQIKMLMSIIRSLFVMIRILLLVYILSSLFNTGILGLLMFADSFIGLIVYFKDISKHFYREYDLSQSRSVLEHYHIINIANYISNLYQDYKMKYLIRRTTSFVQASDEFCSICQNTHMGNYIKINTCKHIYHDVCLSNWFLSIRAKGFSLSCPLCKQCVGN